MACRARSRSPVRKKKFTKKNKKRSTSSLVFSAHERPTRGRVIPDLSSGPEASPGIEQEGSAVGERPGSCEKNVAQLDYGALAVSEITPGGETSNWCFVQSRGLWRSHRASNSADIAGGVRINEKVSYLLTLAWFSRSWASIKIARLRAAVELSGLLAIKEC